MSFRDHLRPTLAGVSSLRLFDYRSRSDVARLDCNELPFAPDAAELSEVGAELASLQLNRYPDVSGEPLRRALSERWHVDPDEILLGNGSIEVLSVLAAALGSGQRDGRPATMLFPDPSFPYYEVIAKTNGLRPIGVSLRPDFTLDERAFAAAIDDHRPALVIVASPNNPTGNVFDPSALERLAQRADAAFVIDEAYVDFASHGAEVPTLIGRVRMTPGLFVTRTFSKIGFAGIRVGALVGARDAIAELDKVRLPWNLDAVSLTFARALLQRPDRLDARVRATVALRRALESDLRDVPSITVFPSEANFILVRTPMAASIVCERLLAQGVLVKDVSRPGLMDRCIRITVGLESDNARCVRALRSIMTSA